MAQAGMRRAFPLVFVRACFLGRCLGWYEAGLSLGFCAGVFPRPMA